MRSASLIFVDGWGIGKDDQDANPYLHARTPFLDWVTEGHGLIQPFSKIICETYAVIPTDACLGISGLPQSATGQTAIITGVNAPLLMGRHINGYPGRSLRQLISSGNIMQNAIDSGFTAFLVNAYSPEYFEMIKCGKRKHAAFALMALAANVPFAPLGNLILEETVYQDITNQLLLKWGHDVPIRQPGEAGIIFHSIAQKYDLSVFEYFQTDSIGHKKDMVAAIALYELLDQFFTGIISEFDWDEDVLIIASDHGNIEDLTTGSHTFNPVPTIILGKRAAKYARFINDITDIAYLMRMVLNHSETDGGRL